MQVFAQLVQTLVFCPLHWLYRKCKSAVLQADEEIVPQANEETVPQANEETWEEMDKFVQNLDFEFARQNIVQNKELLKDMQVAQNICWFAVFQYVTVCFTVLRQQMKESNNRVEMLLFKNRFRDGVVQFPTVFFADLASQDNNDLVKFLKKQCCFLEHKSLEFPPALQHILQRSAFQTIDECFGQNKNTKDVFAHLSNIQTTIVLGCVLTILDLSVSVQDDESKEQVKKTLLQLIKKVMWH